MDYQGRAQNHIQAAEKALGRNALSNFLSGGSKLDEAIEEYEKAVNLLRMAKNHDLAGQIYIKLAECHLANSDNYCADNNYVLAASTSKKTDSQKYAELTQEAIRLYSEAGRFIMAAKQSASLAEFYESNEDSQLAITEYQNAADFYSSEGSDAQTNKYKVKIAELSALTGDYSRAVDIYEEIIFAAVNDKILRYQVKQYCILATLCPLCSDDVVLSKRAFTRYCDIDVTLAESREGIFLSNLITTVENMDVDGFTKIVAKYDDISRLDQLKTKLLLKVKKGIQSQVQDDLL